MARVVAIDPGTRRVGLARSDESGTIAEPLTTLPAEPAGTLVARLAGAAQEAGAEELVVGLPRRLDGSGGPEAQAARRLADDLRRATGMRVTLVDERLSSRQAERALIAAGARREKRRRTLDQVAATLILQTYLAGRHGGR